VHAQCQRCGRRNPLDLTSSWCSNCDTSARTPEAERLAF
jgi:hypothetical protein